MNNSTSQASNQVVQNLMGVNEGSAIEDTNLEQGLFKRKYLYKEYMVFDFDEEQIMSKFEDLINRLDQIL